MRTTCLAIAAGLLSNVAFAQPMLTNDGARPGHAPGVGESLPRSERASNIGSGTMRAQAPSLPQPAVSEGVEVPDYVRAARDALIGGRTGLAQQSIEMAETRLLTRSVPVGMIAPSADVAIAQLRRARLALDAGLRTEALQILDTLRTN